MLFIHLLIAIKIVLTGFLIYRIRRFVRIHRTWELCLVFILFTTLALAELAGTVPPALRQGLPVACAAFILLIALEPEWAWLGTKILQNTHPNAVNQNRALLSEVARAASALSATKTGALITFERNDSLLKFGDTGIEINADVKKELLMSLFTKDTPTHDGGLLIRRGRATHCGAIFPLSERKHIENGLGTRHRAAMGLTEQTDAVCLVVSEEEGTISLAKEGELLYAVPHKEVERKLAKLLAQKSRLRYYPMHYIRKLSEKLVQSNYILLSKSLSAQIFELSTALFWCAVILLAERAAAFPVISLKESIAIFIHTPWAYLPYILFLLSMMTLFSNQRIAFNAALNRVNIQNRLLFLPLWQKKISVPDLEAVKLKRERSGPDVLSLLLLTKKRKSLAIDYATGVKSMSSSAEKIRDVLRIELVN